jgi:hypothetical protein
MIRVTRLGGQRVDGNLDHTSLVGVGEGSVSVRARVARIERESAGLPAQLFYAGGCGVLAS